MKNKTQQLQFSIISTISEVFCGNFSDICRVKESVLHLEAIYFCHNTSFFLNQSAYPIQKSICVYKENGLLPQSTITFFENNRNAIMANWPEEALTSETPEALYESLLESELNITPSDIFFKTDKVSRDMAGAYYTPLCFAISITRRAIDSFIEKKTGIKNYSVSGSPDKEQQVINLLSSVSFLDYSCGCGDFLVAVLDYFESYVTGYPLELLVTQLKGVDVDPIAIMIAIARILTRTKQTLMFQTVSDNFIIGNSLLHIEQTTSLDDKFSNFALNRLYADNEGINCHNLARDTTILLGNPPWEKLRLEEQKFFRSFYPEISKISQKDKRAVKIKALESEWPELANYYKTIQQDYALLKKSITRHPYLKASLVGELNTYALFAELASSLIGDTGFSAIIVKSALVTSTCYSSCFRYFISERRLAEVFLYDNRGKIFSIDSREKFCILFFSKADETTLKVHFGLTSENEITKTSPLKILYEDLEVINPETGLLPNVASAQELSYLLRTHKALPTFSETFPDCHFGRLVHLTAHAQHITTEVSDDFIPIYEGKFIGQYDNRFSTFAGIPKESRYQAKASALRQPNDAYLMQKPIPESRYFIKKEFWNTFLTRYNQPFSLCWRSLTSPTNQRTMIASVMPMLPTCQSIQMLQSTSTKNLLLILALFNSKVFDYFVRLKMSGIDLTQSVVRQIPVPPLVAWEQTVTLNGARYKAHDAVMLLEKQLYRNDSTLDDLWTEIKGINFTEKNYQCAYDLQTEIDEIIFQVYGLSDAEKQIITNSFTS